MTATAQLVDAQTAFAQGDYLRALDIAEGIVRHDPDATAARVLAVNAMVRLERWADAIGRLETLVVEFPAAGMLANLLATCWLRHGNRQREQGLPDDAEQAYGRVLELRPGDPDARFHLASLLLSRNAPAAALRLLEIPDRSGDDVQWLCLRAQALIGCARETEAITLLLPLAQAANPDRDALRALHLLIEAGASAQVLACTRAWGSDAQACKLALDLSDSLRLAGERDAAITLLEPFHASAGTPAQRLRLALPRCLALPAIAQSNAHIDLTREQFRHGLEALALDYPATRVAAIQPELSALAWENFFLAYQGRDDRDLQSQFGDWLHAAVSALSESPVEPRRRKPRVRPRVVVVSSFLRHCTVGVYFASWFEHLARSGFELIAVQIGGLVDNWTKTIGSRIDRLLQPGDDLDAATREIRALDADIVLYPELGMDARTLVLAAQRFAPIQLCAWGHPSTSGLPSIDGYISCAEMEPASAGSHYRERLYGLPGIGTRYASPHIPDAADRVSLGLPLRQRLYLLPQSPFKLHPDMDAVIAAVCAADPAGRIVLFEGPSANHARLLRARLERSGRAIGIDILRQTLFLPQCSRVNYLRVNRACDVMIDSLHWSGGNASLDALHCGLPLVTCPGEFMRGRQSLAMLRRLECDDLVVDSAASLAARVVAIAGEPDQRASASARILAGCRDLVDDDAPLKALADLLHRLVETHACA